MKSRFYMTLGYALFIAVLMTICGHLGITPDYADGSLTPHVITIAIWAGVGFWAGINTSD